MDVVGAVAVVVEDVVGVCKCLKVKMKRAETELR